jgi:cytochrome c heme-lyase
MSQPPPPQPTGPRHAPPESNPLAAGCPVAHGGSAAVGKRAGGIMGGGCPVNHGKKSEPSASGDVRVAAAAGAAPFSQQQHFPELQPEGENVPENFIPAAGRGNSEDGKAWLNPSANQLYRSLLRKDKAIQAEDAPAVATVHVAVTDNTWGEILTYEDLHKKSAVGANSGIQICMTSLLSQLMSALLLLRQCPSVSLSRFQGMDGIYSFKAKLMKPLFGMKPFDRHDWFVDRCGKEVKYVIDYYAHEEPDPHNPGETSIDYFIDARPAPTLAGLWDRSRVAFAKWRRGEKFF